MATKLTKKQQTQLTEKLAGIIQRDNALQLRLSADRSVNEMNVNQISGALNRIHGQAIGKDLPTVVTIPVKQLGSGDPSPDNIRPIIGYEIEGIGTVYGGDLNIETGQLTAITLQTLNGSERLWSGTAVAGTVRRFYSDTSFAAKELVACDSLKVNVDPYTTNNIYISGSRLCLTAEWAQELTTVANFKTALASHPANVVLSNVPPETFTLTPQQMIQLLDQL